MFLSKVSSLIVLFLYHLCYATFIYVFYVYLFLHFYIYLFLCPYVNKVGDPNLSQCRID